MGCIVKVKVHETVYELLGLIAHEYTYVCE